MVEKRYKEFFITAHLSAVCYENMIDIVRELNCDLYALITHDKDKTLEGEEWKDTPTHKHLVLFLKNGTTLKSICNKFEGAHVELVQYKNKAVKYLIHSTDNAREKYQYSLDKIISNSIERVEDIINSVEKEHFNEDKVKEYIAEGTTTKFRFLERFGLSAFKQWWKPYEELVRASYLDEEFKTEIERIITEKEGLPF